MSTFLKYILIITIIGLMYQFYFKNSAIEIQMFAKREITPANLTQAIIDYYYLPSEYFVRQNVWTNTEPVKSYIFKRIPKTGSHSTFNVLQNVCKKYDLRCLIWMCDFYAPCTATLHHASQVLAGYLDKTCFYNHFTQYFNAQRRFLSEKAPHAVRFAILREPISRFVSWYYYRKKMTSIYQDEESKRTLSETIELAYEFHVNNLTAYFNDTNAKHRKQKFNEWLMYINQQAFYLGWNGSASHLPVVEEYVRSMAFVGVTEEMQKSWTYLFQLMHWEEPENDQLHVNKAKANTTEVVENLTADQRNKLEQMLWADIRLYQVARGKFKLTEERMLRNQANSREIFI